MTEAYPLQWPIGWKRSKRPEWARFGEHTVAKAIGYLMDELRLLGASRVVISSNLKLKLDGLPYSSQRQPEDAGVAVYFMLNGNEQCIPCDQWKRVEHNMWAIYKTVRALRGIERWGAKDMVTAAFRGFKALPSPDDVIVPGIRYFDECVDQDHVKKTFKFLAMELHPDKGGDPNEFIEMKRQYEHAIQKG